MEKVATLSRTVFFPAPSELVLFCISISSHKMGLCMSHPKPNQKLCAAPCEYFLLFSPKRNQFWSKYFTLYVWKPNVSWSPGKAVQEDCQGVDSTIPKSFRNICCHHPRNSVCDLICDGTSEMSFRIYNYLKKIPSHFLTELVLWLPNLIDSLFHLIYV